MNKLSNFLFTYQHDFVLFLHITTFITCHNISVYCIKSCDIVLSAIMFERKSSCSPADTIRLYNIYTTSAKHFRRWSNYCMKSYKCFVFTECQYKLLGSSSFQIPAVIQSVCLQTSDQVGARAKGFELLTHRFPSSIYELAVI